MAKLPALVTQLHASGARLVAEKIEDAALWSRCRDLGFDYFQGYFFRKPQLVTHRELTADQLHILSLYNLLQDPAATDTNIVDTFRRNVALSFKLLAMSNAAATGGAGIESIPHALRLLGRKTLARWIAVLLAASRGRSSGTRNELLRETLMRARFCERIGEVGTLHSSAGSLFLIGLLSHMDALLGTPLAEMMARLKLAQPVRDALLQRTGPLGATLRLVEAYEAGRWAEAEVLSADTGVPARRLPALYRESIEWMREFAAVL
jgi:EAL and modified HD-GYP domain-containing signal transduction protein